MSWLAEPEAWIALFTLTSLELVLGVDNLVFLAIVTDRLPAAERPRAQRVGLLGAALMRVLLLLALSWILGLDREAFAVAGRVVTWHDLVLFAGGLFLIGKATSEIHGMIESGGAEEAHGGGRRRVSFAGVVAQVMLLDLVFSLDSVLTAVGLVEELAIMVIAILLAVAAMLTVAGPLSSFVRRHPTLKMLALAFLILIGVVLIADGTGFHVPRGYVYFAMGFSVAVEFLNLQVRKRAARRRART